MIAKNDTVYCLSDIPEEYKSIKFYEAIDTMCQELIQNSCGGDRVYESYLVDVLKRRTRGERKINVESDDHAKQIEIDLQTLIKASFSENDNDENYAHDCATGSKAKDEKSVR